MAPGGERESALTYIVNQVPLILKECSIFPLLGDVLGAPEVDINGVAVRLKDLCGSEDLLGVVATKLDDQRSVLFPSFLSIQN